MEKFTDYLQRDFQQKKDRNPNYSLRAYALFLEESPSLISKIFNNQAKLTPKKIFKFAQKLKISDTDLCSYLIENLNSDYQLSLESKEKKDV